MNAIRGRVRGGRIELESTLPEGAEVLVIEVGQSVPFELDDEEARELEQRTREADAGPLESDSVVLARLRR